MVTKSKWGKKLGERLDVNENGGGGVGDGGWRVGWAAGHLQIRESSAMK